MCLQAIGSGDGGGVSFPHFLTLRHYHKHKTLFLFLSSTSINGIEEKKQKGTFEIKIKLK